MQTLAFKMLLRKKTTASAIITIALLIAILSAVDCIVNNINAQTTALTQLASVGQTYIIKNTATEGLSDSQLDTNLLAIVKNESNIKYATNQQLTQATLTTHNQTYTITVHGVDDVKTYLTQNTANINGTTPKTTTEANTGIILANTANLQKNDPINLTINQKTTQLKIVGVTTTQTQTDTQLIIPLQTLQALTEQNTTINYIEFTLNDAALAKQTIQNLTKTLPTQTQIISTQQVATFAGSINNQTVTFISVWSIAIYIVVIAASYVTASRLINEAGYDLYTLRTLGEKKTRTFFLILAFALAIAVLGTLLGLSVGVVGTQMAATAVRWVFGNAQLAPFIELNQTLQIITIALLCAVAGASYPAVKGSQITTKENPT